MEEENQISEKEKPLFLPNAEKADKSKLDSFWKSLRHFYRTGEKPKDSDSGILKSMFEYALDKKESIYPFMLDPKTELSIDLGKEVPLQILNYVLSKQLKVKQHEFKESLFQLSVGLEKILKIDPEFKADDMEKTYEFANSMMAFDKMAKIVSRKSGKGSNLSEERSERLKSALKTLKEGISSFRNQIGMIIMKDDLIKRYSATEIIKESEVIEADIKDPFQQAMNLFADKIEVFVELIKTYRIASLEADGKYQKDIHDDYFTHFTRHRFFDEEISLFQPLIVIVDYQDVISNMSSLMKLMASNQPIKVLILQDEIVSKPAKEVNWEEAAHQFRQEIVALAISQRNVFAFQSAIDDPQYLQMGIEKLLGTTSPAIAQILISQDKKDQNIDIKLTAASSSRYFPKMLFDPSGSNKMDLSGNVQAEQIWPNYSINVKDEENKDFSIETRLTYADYKALYQEKMKELLLIPAEYYSENLIPLSDYLELDEKLIYGKIPYISCVDEKGILQRVAIPNLWVVSCQERQDFWKFLQQFSSSTKAKEDNSGEEMAKTIRLSEAEYEEKLKLVQENAIQIAAERMIKGLLGDDDILSEFMNSEPSIEAKPKKEEESTEQVEKAEELKKAEPEKPKEEASLIIKASLDTEDCTSCNECVDQFPHLFKYNDDKLAELKDPSKGTFEELVKAAEKCPAACIHPGAPLNSKEANLEKLIKRAEKFN